jgi:hypothetical protein
MKKAVLIALVSLLLSGCSYTDVLSLLPTPLPPTATATATIYLSPTITPSITPTQPTPTFTLTPTLVYPNGSPVPTSTPKPEATLWVLSTGTAEATALPEQPLLGNGPFSTILVPGKELFWGSCEPNTLKITVQLASSVKAVGVVMALRLQDTRSAEHTAWGQAIMDKHDGGVFTYELTAEAFTHYREFKSAWGQYQFIAYTTGLNHVGSTQVYNNSLTIKPCP